MPPPTDTADSATGYSDRKAGLVIFGVLTILVGLVCALMVPFMFFAMSMAAKQGTPAGAHTLLPAVGMYGGMAVMFIWLGIGSIMARRWARALLLIISWSWLVVGVIAMGFMAFLMPKIMESALAAQPAGQPPHSAPDSSVMMWIMMPILGIIYVVMPGIGVLFYRSRHVKATCEALDPVVRWTDRCPLPVVAVSLWLAFTSATMLMMAFSFNGVLPMFGAFVSGPTGAALYVLVALVFGYSARALYKLQWSGWWLVVAVLGLFAVSAFITYSKHDILELYTLMGYSEQELAQIRQFNFLQGNTMAWASLVGMVPFLGYMLFLRRYFPRGA